MATRTLTLAVALGLLTAACNSSRPARDAAAGTDPDRVAQEGAQLEDVTDEPGARWNAPLNLPAEYRPEYHPTTRDYIQEIEGALKPLETISSRAADDGTADAAGSPDSVVGASPLTATRW